MTWVTQSAYAERIGISPATLNYRIKRGKYTGCTRKFGKILKIDLEKALEKEGELMDEAKQRGGLANKAKHQGQPETVDTIPENPDPADEKPLGKKYISLAEAQRIKEVASAELKVIELRRAKRQLLDADEVKRTAFDAGRKVRDSVLNVPDRIADQLATMMDSMEIRQLMEKELKDALTILSREII